MSFIFTPTHPSLEGVETCGVCRTHITYKYRANTEDSPTRAYYESNPNLYFGHITRTGGYAVNRLLHFHWKKGDLDWIVCLRCHTVHTQSVDVSVNAWIQGRIVATNRGYAFGANATGDQPLMAAIMTGDTARSELMRRFMWCIGSPEQWRIDGSFRALETDVTDYGHWSRFLNHVTPFASDDLAHMHALLNQGGVK